MENQVVQTPDFTTEVKLKGFKAYQIDNNISGHNYNRKDFYKVSLNTGKYLFHYADRSYETDGTILFFGNPRIPYSCDLMGQINEGYASLFTEDFLKLSERSEGLLQSPLFKIGGTPILQVNAAQKSNLTSIYQRMIAEQDADYAYKDEVIRNYLHLIIHEAVKIQPTESIAGRNNANERITAVFLELLERQFPIENTQQPLVLKTAQDFAKYLAVHVNHLNSAVKDVTGKTTTNHIADRIISEAKALLQHTDWNIAEIAYALGFDYPTYFNNFFKKKTGDVPKAIRAAIL